MSSFGAPPSRPNPTLDPFSDAAFQQRMAQARTRFTPSEPDAGVMDYVMDGVLGVGRGIGGLAQSVYSLGDMATGGALPDWEADFSSDTWAGDISSALVQFLIPFGGAARAIGSGSKIARFAGLSKLSKAAQNQAMLNRAALEAAKATGKVAPSVVTKARLIGTGRAAAAGAVADFVGFQGNEARFSNLIQSFPALANPITGFLAADTDEEADSWSGRLKNVVEGLGMGVLTDGLLHVLKRVRVARKTGKSIDDIDADPDLVEAYLRADEDARVRGSAEASKPDPIVDRELGNADSPKWERIEGAGDAFTLHWEDGVDVRIKKIGGQWQDLDTGRKLGKTQHEAQERVRRQSADVGISEGQLVDGKLDALTEDGRKVTLEKVDRNGKKVWAGKVGDDTVVLRSAFIRERNGKRRLITRHFTGEEALGILKDEGPSIDVTGLKVGPKTYEGTAGDLAVSLKRDSDGVWRGTVGEDTVQMRRRDTENRGTARKSASEWVEVLEDGSDGKSLGKNRENALRQLTLDHAQRQARETIQSSTQRAFDDVAAAGGANNLNLYTPEQIGDLGEVIRQKFQNPEASAVNPRDLDPEELLVQELKKNDLNLARMPAEPAAMQRAIAKVLRDVSFPEAANAVKNLDLERQSLDKLNDMLGIIRSPDDPAYIPLGVMSGNLVQKSQDVLVETMAWRVLLRTSADNTVDIAAKMLKAGADEQEGLMAQFIQAVDTTAHAMRTVKGATAIQGRALQTNNIPFRNLDQLLDILDVKAARETTVDLAEKIAALQDNPSGLFSLIESATTTTIGKILTETWMNAILSGPRTWFVNGIGGAMMVAYRPLERAVGSALIGQSASFRIAMQEYQHMWSSIGHAFRAAQEGFMKNADPLLGGSKIDAFDSVGAGGITKAQGHVSAQGFNAAAKNWGVDLGLDASQGWGKAADIVGHNLVRVPGRVLQGTDAFFKHLSYRSNAYSIMLREEFDRAVANGAPVHWPDLATAAERRVDDLIYKNQALSEQTLINRAMDELAGDPRFETEFDRKAAAVAQARSQWNDDYSILQKIVAEDSGDASLQATFQTPINPDGNWAESVTAHVQQAVNNMPLLRIFLPFIRTPFNIAQWASHRTLDPAIGVATALLQKQFPNVPALKGLKNRFLQDFRAAELLGPDAGEEALRLAAKKKAEAVGRLSLGFGMTMAFAAFAANGKFTGRGPKDKEQRELWIKAGNQPYSFRVGDSWVEYRRLDPFATILGTVADFYETLKVAHQDDQEVLEDIPAAIAFSLAQQVTNKTFLIGLKNLFDGLSGDENKIQRILQNYAGSTVPRFVSEVGGFLAGDEPVYREVNGFVDAVASKLPYVSDSVDPVRNFMGEPVRKIQSVFSEQSNGVTDLILPIAYSEVSSDLLNREIGLLQHGFSPPRARLGGVDLRDFKGERGQSAYDRMLELRGQVRIGGKTLRRALMDLVRARSFKAMDPISTPEGLSPRIAAVQRVVTRFHNRAKAQMLREYPDALQAITDARVRAQQKRSESALQSIEAR